jgi:hypothetical protein
LRYREELQRCGAIVDPDDAREHLVGGGAICELGIAADVPDPSRVMPDYRREADASLAHAASATAGSV